MSRSPIYKKDEYSRANMKAHASVPKRFPTALLEPKSKQPIESIHKIMNFVAQKRYPSMQKENSNNKSTHQLHSDPYDGQFKNVTFARQPENNHTSSVTTTTRDASKSPIQNTYARNTKAGNMNNQSYSIHNQTYQSEQTPATSTASFRPFNILQRIILLCSTLI